MIKKYKQFNEGIRHLLVGPSNEEILKHYQNQYDNGKTDLIHFYSFCKKEGIKGGPKKEEVKNHIEEKFKTNKLDILDYYYYNNLFKLNCNVSEDDVFNKLNSYSKDKMLNISITIKNERGILAAVKRGANIYSLYRDESLSKLLINSGDELVIKKLLLCIIKYNRETKKILNIIDEYNIDNKKYRYFIIQEYIKSWYINHEPKYIISDCKNLSESLGIDEDEFQIILCKNNIIDIDKLYKISKHEKLEKSFMYCFENRKKLTGYERNKLYSDVIHDYDLDMIKQIVNDKYGYNINKEYMPRLLFYYLIRNDKLDIFEYLFGLYKETELWNLQWLYNMITNDKENNLIDVLDQDKIKHVKELIKKRMKEFSDKEL